MSAVTSALVIAAALTLSCAHTPSRLQPSAKALLPDEWLATIQDGVTTRAGVATDLGQPTVWFEGGRIFAYRLIVEGTRASYPASEERHGTFFISGANLLAWVARKESHDVPLVWELSRDAEYALVLVFDDAGTLRRHVLKRILP